MPETAGSAETEDRELLTLPPNPLYSDTAIACLQGCSHEPFHRYWCATEDAPDLLESTNPLESTIPGYAYLVWEAGQGSEVWFQFDMEANTIKHTTPAFKGETSIAIAVTNAVEEEQATPLDGLLQGWVNPQGNNPENGDYPMVFTWLDKGLHPPMEYPQIHTFQITAFAHELMAYPDDDAFSAATERGGSTDDDDGIKVSFAAESFIPMGMFVENGNPPNPTAMFTGRVLEVTQLTSPLDDKPFFWMRVKTFGGEYDVVASSDAIEGEPVTGGIVSGVF